MKYSYMMGFPYEINVVLLMQREMNVAIHGEASGFSGMCGSNGAAPEFEPSF